MAMHPFFCAWLLIFGVYYNTQYIKSIKVMRNDVYVNIPISVERSCLPYVETGPCYLWHEKKVFNRTDDVYIITIANTESGGDTEYVYDTILHINNFTHPQQYAKITEYMTRCVNICN